jgi:rRNA-processing protein FCF1
MEAHRIRCNHLTVKLIVDASFLLECIQRKIDIVEKLEERLNSKVKLVILKPVYDEILRLSTGSNRKSHYARLAIQLLNRIEADLVDVNGKEPVDTLIEQYACKFKIPVATNDLNLRKRLTQSGIPVLYVRGLSKIDVDHGEYLGMVKGLRDQQYR